MSKSSSNRFASVAILQLVLLSLFSGSAAARDVPATSGSRRREVIAARHGAVAADDGRCSRIGRDVLREGGNAVDAAVAAAFCLGVVSAASSGIGGGAFMLVRMASGGRVQAFDMRETAPTLASQNMYAGNASRKASGPLSIAVPGEVAGLYEAWRQLGKLPWKRLVGPAEELARKGFKISPYLHMQMARTESGIKADEGLRSIFTSQSDGALLRIGDICRNKNLAKTLREIAKTGFKSFYNGSIGLNLVRDVRKAGGILTMKDLQSYRVKIRKPIRIWEDRLGLQIFSMPPPSAGGAAMALILNILARYGFPRSDSKSEALAVHREIEALKHAFAVRMNLGDPDFVNVTEVLSDMLSPKFAAELQKTIYDNMTFGPSHYGGRWNLINDHGTSHISVVDRERNAVSMTNTVNSYFGAQFLSPSTGILLNNEMDDFSIPVNRSANVPPPAPANFIRPFKRPISSMTPTIVLQGEKLKGVVGASGGSMIIAGTTEVFLNYFARGMDPLSSVMAPRYYHQGNPALGGSKKLDCRTKKDVIKPAGKPDSSPHKDIGGKRDYLSKRATHKSASDMKSGKLPSCISKGKPAPSSTIMRGSLAKANSSLRDGLTNKNTLKEITGATPVRNRDPEKRRAPVGVTGKSLQLTGCHANLRKGQSENQRPKSMRTSLAAWGKSTESLAIEIGYNNHVRGVKQKQLVNASSGRVPKPTSPVMPSIQKAPNLKQGHKIVPRQSGDLRSAQRNPRQMLPSWR